MGPGRSGLAGGRCEQVGAQRLWRKRGNGLLRSLTPTWCEQDNWVRAWGGGKGSRASWVAVCPRRAPHCVSEHYVPKHALFPSLIVPTTHTVPTAHHSSLGQDWFPGWRKEGRFGAPSAPFLCPLLPARCPGFSTSCSRGCNWGHSQGRPSLALNSNPL